MPLRHRAHLMHAAHFERQLMRARESWLRRSQVEGAAEFDVDWPNVLLAQAWAKAHMATENDAAQLCSELGEIAPFLIDLRLLCAATENPRG